jgi:methylenetetrahydrofolate reductase (NADPH)
MALGLPSTMPGGARTVRELLASGERSFSFEFFPPKSDEGEAVLWSALRDLEALRPTFVSVTYGAGGSTRDRTVRLTKRIAADTSMTPVGHLTCVGSTNEELRRIVGEYVDAGVRNMLALRGDPPEGPGQPWTPTPGGLDHASDLVALLCSLGDFCVGVAAFPEGHPESPSLEHDVAVLLAKQEAGADFAITQLFFRAEDYLSLVDRAQSHGVRIPIIPGVMPVTDVAQIQRFAALAGASFPAELQETFLSVAHDPNSVRELGVEVATALCRRLLDEGAPGLHLYTLNRSTSAREVYLNLGIQAGARS